MNCLLATWAWRCRAAGLGIACAVESTRYVKRHATKGVSQAVLFPRPEAEAKDVRSVADGAGF